MVRIALCVRAGIRRGKATLQNSMDAEPEVASPTCDEPATGAPSVHSVSGSYSRVFLPLPRNVRAALSVNMLSTCA